MEASFQLEDTCDCYNNFKICENLDLIKEKGMVLFEKEFKFSCNIDKENNTGCIKIGDFKLDRLPQCLTFLSNITHLFISNSYLEDVNIIPQGVIWLEISGEKVKKISADITNLQNLTLKRTSIVNLDISNTKIRSFVYIKGNQGLKQLRVSKSITNLHLDYCDEINFDELKLDQTSLIELSAVRCNLKRLPNLPETLKYLYLTSNKITYIEKLPLNLISLYLSGNLCEKIDYLPGNLEHLLLSSNRIRRLSSLPKNLKILTISDNPIRKIYINSPNLKIYHTGSDLEEIAFETIYEFGEIFCDQILIVRPIRQLKFFKFHNLNSNQVEEVRIRSATIILQRAIRKYLAHRPRLIKDRKDYLFIL